MLIKYKGNTSSLLTDLSLELKIPVNLKTSEDVLTIFFERIMKELSLEKSIEFICNLPPYLKPFCTLSAKEPLGDNDFFSKSKLSFTIMAVMKVFEKYIEAENLIKVYSCFPESFFSSTYLSKKEILIRA